MGEWSCFTVVIERPPLTWYYTGEGVFVLDEGDEWESRRPVVPVIRSLPRATPKESPD